MQSCPKIVRENRTNSGLWLALNRRMTLQSSPLVQSVIASAIDVHAALGPGLLESSYRQCIAREFDLRAIRFEAEVAIPLTYKGLRLDCGYRVDFVVDASLVVELKAVEKVLPIHHAQTLTYLKLLKVRQGLILNFNVPRLVDGVKSFLL